MDKGLLVVVSGFSGVGKGTIVKKLVDTKDNYSLSISATTRKKRVGEIDGVEYFFISKEEFENKINTNGLLEYALYVENYYGTPREYVESKLQSGDNVILEIEQQGAFKVKEQFPDALLVFVVPRSMEILLERLRKRGTESEEIIKARINQGKKEILKIKDYDYILVNDNIDIAVEELDRLIKLGEKNPEDKSAIIRNLEEEFKNL